MKNIIIALSSIFLFSQLTFASDSSCDAMAAEKKLSGAAKSSFLKKCEREAKVNTAMQLCEGKAAEKKLAGAAKNSFMKKCERDTKADTAMKECEAKAAEKKLKGAAKSSYTKKCVTDETM